MSVLKRLGLAVGLMLLLGTLVLAAALLLVDRNRYRGPIEDAFERATGRELALEGDIDLAFFPWLALTTGAASVGSGPGFDAPLASWRGARVGVQLRALLRGELIVDRVRFEGLEIALLSLPDGRNNWSLEASASGEPLGELPAIAGLELLDSALEYRDLATGTAFAIRDWSLDVEPLQLGAPMRLDTRFVLDAASRELAIDLQSPRLELSNTVDAIVLDDFELRAADAVIRGDAWAEFGSALDAGAELALETDSLRATLVALGVEPPSTTDAAVLGRLDGTVQLHYGADGLALAPFELQLDDTKLSGSLRQPAGTEPIHLQLNVDRIDVARYLTPDTEASEPFEVPVTALRALRLRGRIEIEEAVLEDTVMRGVGITLEQGDAPP